MAFESRQTQVHQLKLYQKSGAASSLVDGSYESFGRHESSFSCLICSVYIAPI